MKQTDNKLFASATAMDPQRDILASMIFAISSNRWKGLGPSLAGVLLMLTLTGCATAPDANPRDPFESFNRGVSDVNDTVDRAVLKPVATAYTKVAPDMVRTGVSNFFRNIGDAWSTVNATLQLRPREATENALRFGVNTVFGVVGLVDIASEMGLERTTLDFGQTLGRWGVPPGPYLVLPIFGPSSVRDAAGFTIESRGDLVMGVAEVSLRNSLYALRAVETRANLLRASSMLEGAALDKYTFTRDIFLSRRESQIEDLKDKGVGLKNADD